MKNLATENEIDEDEEDFKGLKNKYNHNFFNAVLSFD